jgi:predicted ATPase
MYLTSIQVKNYKCFYESGKISFSSRRNVIVGKNNSGKTALMEALSLSYPNKPHRSEKTLPTQRHSPNDSSEVEIEIEIPKGELYAFLENYSGVILIPQLGEAAEVLKALRDKTLRITAKISQNKSIKEAYLTDVDKKYGGQSHKFEWDAVAHKIESRGLVNQTNRNLTNDLVQSFLDSIYYFRAERFNIGQHKLGTGLLLRNDASNLPQVLNVLQTGDPKRYRTYVDLLKEIFPEIESVIIPPVTDTDVRIEILNNEDRSDLAIYLSESGLGLGQIMSMLFVALTSDYPRTILIDEPQNFLHPGAIRKFFSIMNHYFPIHQYIVSTHSPIVISAMNPESIIQLVKINSESTGKNIDSNDKRSIESLLSLLGIRFSDVFGADNVLWVEGPTEEACFPLLVTKLLDKPLLGTIILGVLNTGDFLGKDAKKTISIYKKLTDAISILPPAIGFIFDREGKSKKLIDDLEHLSCGTISHTERRMYENYLLDFSAIADVLTKDMEGSIEEWTEEDKITNEQVQDWIGTNGLSEPYIDKTQSITEIDEEWFKYVHGAQLLNDIFNHFSSSRLSYNKKYHGLELTKIIVNDNPEVFINITNKIKELFKEYELTRTQ